MTELLKRALTGVFIVAAVTAGVIFGPVTFFMLCTIIGIPGVAEFYRLHGLLQNKVRMLCAFALSIVLFACTFNVTYAGENELCWLMLIPVSFCIFLTVFLRDSPRPFDTVALIFLAHIYFTLPVILFYLIAFLPTGEYQWQIPLGYFFLLWSHDTGAYLSGKVFGRTPLAPDVSPNKTWEGSAGGFLFAILFASVDSYFFSLLTFFNWVVLALIVIIFGSVGDLTKSVMKRSFNVKDSGNIFPGHGGILDRFDSLVGSAPFVFAYLKLVFA